MPTEMKAVYQNKSLKTRSIGSGFSSKRKRYIPPWAKETFITFTLIVTIFLFMYTATSKLISYKVFVFQMQLVPLPLIGTWAPFLGWAVPVTELVLVVMLYLNTTHYWGLIGSFILMLSFEIYIVWMKFLEIQTGIHLPCTCGGIISNMGWTSHLLFNGAFILLLALSIYFRRQLRRMKNITDNSLFFNI